ncbi:MAG: geranylgeranylglycerol-phosphate geranylgeranyltransferase [Chitinophagales bacterium]|nr:geranylgeranylglycerol-phosphate geranylgeranyltransferase [Chitinophagales bacterium]
MWEKIKGFFRLIRWFNLLIAGLCFIFFHQFIIRPALVNVEPTLNLYEVIALALAVMSIMAAGNILNDYYDYPQDNQFKPKRVVIGKYISYNVVPYWVVAFNLLGLALAAWISYTSNNLKLLNIFFLAALLLWQYSAVLKRYFLVGNIVVAFLCGVVFILPVLYEKKLFTAELPPRVTYYVFAQMKGYFVFAFFITLIREIVKDAEDYEADKEYGMRTLPVVIGMRKAALVAGSLQLMLMIAILFVLYIYWKTGLKNHFWYAALFVFFPLLVNVIPLMVAHRGKDFAVQSVMLKLSMVFGLASLPLFYVFNRFSL